MSSAHLHSLPPFNVANVDANVTFIQCDKPNQIGPWARRQIRSQVMRTSWRKRKRTTITSLPATDKTHLRPFDTFKPIDSMALPDYLFAMQLKRGFNEPLSEEDMQTKPAVECLSLPINMMVHQQLLDSSISSDMSIDIVVSTKDIESIGARKYAAADPVAWAIWYIVRWRRSLRVDHCSDGYENAQLPAVLYVF
jgi:hypothetical protein